MEASRTEARNTKLITLEHIMMYTDGMGSSAALREAKISDNEK